MLAFLVAVRGTFVGVRDLVARGYVILGGVTRRGGGRPPALRVARRQTPSGVRVRWVGLAPLGPVGARQGPVWSHMGRYISRTVHQYGTVD